MLFSVTRASRVTSISRNELCTGVLVGFDLSPFLLPGSRVSWYFLFCHFLRYLFHDFSHHALPGQRVRTEKPHCLILSLLLPFPEICHSVCTVGKYTIRRLSRPSTRFSVIVYLRVILY